MKRWIESRLWHPRVAGLPLPVRAAIEILRFIYAILRDVASGPLPLHAMGLVYVTILSLVPLLAVIFSIFKAFGYHRRLEPLLFDLFTPLGPRGAELTQSIIGFVNNVHGEVLAGIGLLFLFFTALSMAEQIEGTFNQIWHVGRPRSLGRRVSEYLSIILVGPVVMVTSMALIATLRSTTLVRELSGMTNVGLGGLSSELVPYLLVCLGFSFVYWFVPNTRVRGSAALAGGLVGGVLWAATGALFAAFVANATTTISIYATFAIVMIALFWLYLCWLILLVGAQVAFYVQYRDYMRIGYRQPLTGTGHQEQTALTVMLLVSTGFRDGGSSTRLSDITRATGLPGHALSPVAARLEAAGLLAQTADERWLPKGDPAQVLLREIVHAVRHPEGSDLGPEIHWPDGIAELSQSLEAGLENLLGMATLESLIERRATAEDGDASDFTMTPTR